MKRTPVLVSLAIAALIALYASGYSLGLSSGLDRLASRAEASLTRADDRLSGQLEKYQYFPSVIALYPTIKQLLAAPDPGTVTQANLILERLALGSGALDIYVMDRSGMTVAASNHNLDRSFIGENFGWRPYFKGALLGSLSRYLAVGSTSLQRGFYFAHPVYGDGGPITGVVAVKIDLSRLETEWRGDQDVVFFTDENGAIFLSNRDSLLLKTLGGAQIDPDTLPDSRQYAGSVPQPLTGFETETDFGHEVWTDVAIDGVPSRVLHLSRQDDRIGLRAHTLVSTQDADTQGRLWGILAIAIGGVFILSVAIVIQRRNAMTAALALEERAKQTLETTVERRTRDLSVANARLRQEVEERAAAEAELRRVQDELVQAGKLSALGEMSAGISHELNQPLAAIQTLADNAGLLLERDQPDMVRGNITKISQMADRAGRIIRNLRAFARKEDETITDVDLVQVVNDAISLSEPKLSRQEVTLNWTPPADPVHVRGGKVRLQQVIMNLISNAADAMAGQRRKRSITITISHGKGRIHLKVRDTGPGLAKPDQVFDPFYTTKTVGEGLGLGLSISYGIVQSFGGDISGHNHASGGATFTVKLTPSTPAARAAE